MKEAEKELPTELKQVKRFCKCCNIEVGKGKQYCEPCRKGRDNTRHKEKRKTQPITDQQRTAWREQGRKRRGSTKEMKWLNSANNHFKKDGNGNILEKFCTGCETWKTPDCYDKRKDTPTGLVARCKPCANQQHKKYQKKPTPKSKSCIVCGHDITNQPKRKRCVSCANTHNIEKEYKRTIEQREINQTIHVITHKQCRNCKDVKPLREFVKGGDVSTLKIRPRSCNECKRKNRNKIQRKRCSKRNRTPARRIRDNINKRMKDILKSAGTTKPSFSSVIGCNGTQLKIHLESQFRKWMTWGNYGSKWHIDHIVPCSSFNHTDKEQVKRCWHYSNLRPLCAIENVKKSDSIITCQPELLLSFG